MKVVINQSNYIPWKGYFDLIHDADLMIFLDNTQFTPRDWRSRNKIKTSQGSQWLTIPVGNDRNRLISEVNLPCGNWAKKHWMAISQAYGKTPFFHKYKGFFEDLYLGSNGSTLSEFNQHTIKTVAREFLGITTAFANASDFETSSRKQQLILDLLLEVGATTYISGPTAKAYIDPEAFVAAGVELVWKDYSGYPEYSQPFPPFDHAVSIIDLLFCAGPASADCIWGWREAGRPNLASRERMTLRS
ncbi:MAG: WbqC family protein [Bdellovibrionales bacterium]